MSKTVGFLIEMKVDGQPTKYQAYQLLKYKRAGGIAIKYNYKEETIKQLVERMIKIRDNMLRMTIV